MKVQEVDKRISKLYIWLLIVSTLLLLTTWNLYQNSKNDFIHLENTLILRDRIDQLQDLQYFEMKYDLCNQYNLTGEQCFDSYIKPYKKINHVRFYD